MDAPPHHPVPPSADRIDRNWTELLQELRVAQTGVQILSAFLLTVPFAPGFEELDDHHRAVFAVVLWSALTSVLLLMTPVALHRQLFRRGERAFLVNAAHQLARVGLVLMAVAYVGAAWTVLDVVLSLAVAWTVAGLLALTALGLWVGLPLWVRHVRPRA
ncbi:hypothetical protein ASD11_14915 [Aeromicrobium sp. Root495]|uniref:DUF6328 family protein n=1 Tax=Aeromicrobium sp. Root495 TaxID=1736550 RepID=UPI0006FC1443|nr:DUF6328 family protein [Aeromicrobium sp. Root495]KQY55793.1 hypothetical protein ASD11_14915 [Aeromicrobium sp. Root495]